MKTKLLAIIIAAVLLLGAGAGIGVAIYCNQPYNVAGNAILNAFDDLSERDEIEPIANILTKGSVDFAVNEMKNDDTDLLAGGKFLGKLYFSDKAFMLEDLLIENDMGKISGDIYVSDKLAYVSEDEILENAYGLKYKDIVDELEDSIFAYGSDSEYAFQDEEEYEKLIKALECLNDGNFEKDAEKLAKKLAKKAWKIACDNFEFETENDKVRVGGERENVRVVTITIDGDSMASFAADFYEYLDKDDSVVKFLEKYEDLLNPVLVNANGIEEGKSVADAYEEYIAEYIEELDDRCDEIEESFTEDVVIKVMTPRTSQKLAKLVVEVGEVEVFDLDIGVDGIKKADRISVTVLDSKYTYEVKEDNSKEFECVLKHGDESIKLSLDKKKDKFTLSFNEMNVFGYDNVKISGDFKSSFGKTTIEIDKFEYDTSYVDYEKYPFEYITETKRIDCDITIVLDQSDKIPSAPKKYDQISDIMEEDIEKWVSRYFGDE